MDFKERLDLAKNILSDCPYKTQKEKIIDLFNNTNNDTPTAATNHSVAIDENYK